MARRAEIVAPPVLLMAAPMMAPHPAHGTLSPNELRQIIEGVLG